MAARTLPICGQRTAATQPLESHYANRFDAFRRDMEEWLAVGKVRLREDVVAGLENAPSAFIGLLEGRNFGKLVVRLTDA